MLGLWADSWPAVERDIRPQLSDPSVSYPHTPADQQTVPSSLLWRLSVVLPFASLPLLLLLPPPHRHAARLHLLCELWLGLLSSVAVAFLLTCVIKARVGRLRPDFLARCKLEHGACTGLAAVVAEGRRSFPSGHSSLCFSGLGFLSAAALVGLLHTPTPRAGSLGKLSVAALPWLLALLVGLSRISDYWRAERGLDPATPREGVGGPLSLPSCPAPPGCLPPLLHTRVRSLERDRLAVHCRHHWQDVLVGTLIGNAAAYVGFRLRFAPGDGLLPRSASEWLDGDLSVWKGAKPRRSPPDAV